MMDKGKKIVLAIMLTRAGGKTRMAESNLEVSPPNSR